MKTERHEEAGIQGESQMMIKTRDWSDTSTSQGVTGNDSAGLGPGGCYQERILLFRFQSEHSPADTMISDF